jgi:uncharacterized protein YuzE
VRDRYLEVTFRGGRPFAGYLHLHRRPGDVVARSQRMGHGLLVDYTDDGRPIGIEITAPEQASAESINEVLARCGVAPIDPAELAPLQAA